jgi:hypothetical protein
MSAESQAEKWADWCDEAGSFAICGTRVVEHSRRSEGIKWCFHCRTRHEFWWVVMVPDGLSYYGPHVEIQGIKDDCTEMFPGWTRELDEH